ncbi:hypothetical protein BDN67DRAFT_985114 [Paxillus ammoniavirescens]|nr:hypothetical protein BDN67DRAFT_985114 [Paxillus ammoniavirescens]
MSTRQPGTLRWAAPEQIKEDTCRLTTKSDIYSFGNLALQASALATNSSSALSLLQVFSRKLPWSGVRGGAAVVLILAQGQKPRRPQSSLVYDRHWGFIEHCWSQVQLSTQLPNSQPTSSGWPLTLIDMDIDDDKTSDVDDTSIVHSVLTAHPGCSGNPMQVYLLRSQGGVFSGPQLPAASPLSPLPPDAKMLSVSGEYQAGPDRLNFDVWLLVTRFVRLGEAKGVPNDRGAEGWDGLACSAPTDVITIMGGKHEDVNRGSITVSSEGVIWDSAGRIAGEDVGNVARLASLMLSHCGYCSSRWRRQTFVDSERRGGCVKWCRPPSTSRA